MLKFFEKPSFEVVALDGPPDEIYAHVLTRIAALIIDGLLLTIFNIFISMLIRIYWAYLPHFGADGPNDTVILNLTVLIWCFTIVFGFWNFIYRMGTTGQSIGRQFLGVAVLDQRGLPIGVGRALFRETIGRLISTIVLQIGFLRAFWHKERQMWHDEMVGCYVYYVNDIPRETVKAEPPPGESDLPDTNRATDQLE